MRKLKRARKIQPVTLTRRLFFKGANAVDNFLDPAILFFVFGVFAGLVRSNLEIPAPIARFLSLYLLMALGLKGGFALQPTAVCAATRRPPPETQPPSQRA